MLRRILELQPHKSGRDLAKVSSAVAREAIQARFLSIAQSAKSQ